MKSVIDKTRVCAGHGHPGKRLDECQQYMVRAAKRLEIAKQAVVAEVAEQDRLQEEYSIGSARLEELKKEASATPHPMEVDGNTDRIQQLEAMVSELRRERDDLRSHDATSKRAGEVVADATILIPEALEELSQWITSTSARMSMAMEREDLALVAELSAQLAAGGRSWPARRGGATLGHRSCFRSDVRVREASHVGPQSTRIDSDDEPIFPSRFSPWCHCDSVESVPIPGTPPGAANDSTVAPVDVQSGEEQDGFVSVVP